MKKPAAVLLIFLWCFLQNSQTFAASPWTEKEGYFGKTKAKFGFGFKNAVFGWTNMFMEPYLSKYKTPWEGFCYGTARSVFYTANGLIHLATFPIPVDFPDMGQGLHMYSKDEMVPNTVEERQISPN